MENQRKKGSEYEQKAARFLTEHGYRIIQQNYQCRFGEVDIIAANQEYLVFVEVKYRKNREFGTPEEAVNDRKRRKISKVAQNYLAHRHMSEVPIRFDVVSILGEQISLYKNAFEFCG